jgi:hypothetical protein
MKFMQRKKHDKNESSTFGTPTQSSSKGELMTSPNSAPKEEKQKNINVSAASSTKQKEFKWKIDVLLPTQPESTNNGRLDCKSVVVDVRSHSLSRRSFNGFNIVVEREYEEARGDPESTKRSVRLEKEAIGDDEMANFYAKRVKSQQKPEGKGAKSAKGPQRISGCSAQSHDSSQKRKKR